MRYSSEMSMLRAAAAGALLAIIAIACGGEIEPASGAGALAAGDSESSTLPPGSSSSGTYSPPPCVRHCSTGTGKPASQGYPASPSDAGSSQPIDAGPSPSIDAGPYNPPDPEPTPAPFDWVASCPAAPTTAFVADPITVFSSAQTAIVGRWRGTHSNPWWKGFDPMRESIDVAIDFEANGHYSGRTLSPNWGRAFYYGTDLDSPLKQYRLEDLLANGTVVGEIDIVFWYSNDTYAVSGYQGYIDDLAFDATRDRMRFEVWYDRYGPMKFDLWRCP